MFPLSEEFGAWRALSRDRSVTHDFSPLQGATIEEDLGQRDFTVNAMAVPLGGGDLIDPHGGERRPARRDAAGGEPGRLRGRPAAAAAARALRGRAGPRARRRDRAPHAAAAPRLTEPSPERVFAELRRVVVAGGVELADRLGVLDAVLPELTALRGIEQSRFHHLDVFEHTLEVLRRLSDLELEPEVEAVLAEPLADELTRGEALRFGALFHDVAKPATQGVRPDGRVTFIGHDAAGEEMAAGILRRLRASERLRSYVAKLTREHLVLGFMVHERPLDRRALHAYLRRCEPVEVEVTVLSCADRLATRGEAQEPWIAAHLELARDVMAAGAGVARQRPSEAPAAGRRAGSGVRPELGELVRELEEAVYAGEVKDRDQALALVARLRQDSPP